MILGESPEIQRALTLADRFARTKVPVLLVGARGTGKELFARYIHDRSGRSGEFVDVNCGALPQGLAEGLLFGHRKGAFTGALQSHSGWLVESHGGTLFLDEFGDLPLDCQAKVLRALESGEIRPLGQRGKTRVDFRIVTAVQEGVRSLVARGAMRSDLVDRIAVGVVPIPALRDRGDDVALLARHFAGADGRTLESGVCEVLRNYEWPGNVRELRSVIARAGCLVDNGTLSPDAVAEAISLGADCVSPTPARLTIPVTVDGWVTLGARHGWHAGRMACGLGISRTTLFAHLKDQKRSLRRLRGFRVRQRSSA